MAIFGACSNWDGKEMKEEFFKTNKFVIGWDYDNAEDLYSKISSLKAGDIIYLKSSKSGSRNIVVKGIGIVLKSMIHSFIEEATATKESIKDWNGIFVSVEWIIDFEFKITVPKTRDKSDAVRSLSFYEEHLPFVHEQIIGRLFDPIRK